MKIKSCVMVLVQALLLALFCQQAVAELYYWTDDAGKLHVTDNIKEIPEKYKDSSKVQESQKPAAGEKPPEVKPEKPSSYEPSAGTFNVDLYDGQTALWWKNEYDALRKKVEDRINDMSSKKQYVDLFERGRKYGQLYEKKEVDLYLKYKDELPLLDEQIKVINVEIEDFKRKARYYGVPKEAVGD